LLLECEIDWLFCLLQVTTVTKVVREVHHVGPDGQPVEYVSFPAGAGAAPGAYPAATFGNYEHLPGQEPYGAAPDAGTCFANINKSRIISLKDGTKNIC
jgi:hypothetical protein